MDRKMKKEEQSNGERRLVEAKGSSWSIVFGFKLEEVNKNFNCKCFSMELLQELHFTSSSAS